MRATLHNQARKDMQLNIRVRVFQLDAERKMGKGLAVRGSYVPDTLPLDPTAFDGPASGEVLSKSQDVPAPPAKTQVMGVSKDWQRANWSEKQFTVAQINDEVGWHIPVYLPELDESMAGQSASRRLSWLQNTTSHWFNGKEYRSYSHDDVRYPGASSIGFPPDGGRPVWVTTPPFPNVASIGDDIHVILPSKDGNHAYVNFSTTIVKRGRYARKAIFLHIAVGELWGGIKITASRFSRSLIWDHKYGKEDWRCSQVRACVSQQNSNNVAERRQRASSPAASNNRNEYQESCLHSSDGSGYAVEMQEERGRVYKQWGV